MKLLIATILYFLLSLPNGDISMYGVKIGSSQQSLKKIRLKIEANGDNMTKYITENGNAFSVTCEAGKVVYMENDWLHEQSGIKPLFSNFQFGRTSLRDIRKKFATNGFTYKSRPAFSTETDVIEFNCFEFDSPNNEILVTVTKIPLTAKVTEDNVSDSLKLDAIIIADKSYLETIWSNERLKDPNYRKIKPD